VRRAPIGQARWPALSPALRGRRGSRVKGGRRPSRSDREATLEAGGADPYRARRTPEPPKKPPHKKDSGGVAATEFVAPRGIRELTRG